MAISFGTSTSITITASSLAANAARSSAAITAGTANIANIPVTINITTTATTTTVNRQAVIYAYCSEDGTNYTGASGTLDDVDGTDKALTGLASPTSLRFLGTVPLVIASQTIRRTFDIVQAFGFVPKKWGIVIHNDAGTPLGAVSCSYSEVSYS